MKISVIDYKKNNIDVVVIGKSGSFFVAYDDDAIIMSYLFSYQINDNKVGFPLNSLERILAKLDYEMISYYVIDDKKTEKKFDNNKYNQILLKAKKNYYNELNAKLLIDEINFIIKNNPSNINKIREFIYEL